MRLYSVVSGDLLAEDRWNLDLNETVEWIIHAVSEEDATLNPLSFDNSASIPDGNYVQNEAITSVTLPAATGGDAPLTYSLSPSLPAGLAFDGSTRVLSGTPTAAASARTYTYTVTDADGDTATLTFDISVTAADFMPSFEDQSISNQSYEENRTIDSMTLPAATGGDAPLTYSLSPSLPAGLTFDGSTRVLSGTPTAAASARTYTYTVTDADGDTATLTFDISVTAARVSDEEEKKAVTQVVADVAAVTLSNVTANIGTRFSAPTGSTGIALAPSGAFGKKPAPSFVPAATDLHGISDSPLEGTSDPRTRTLTLDDLLRSGAFQVALGASEGATPEAGMGTTPQWTVWGRGDLQFFESKPERGSTYDGDLKAGYLGVDAQLGDQWLAGLAASRTRTEADYGLAGSGAGEDGRLEVTLNSLHPYLRFAPDARSELWTILGAGRGEIENARGGASAREKSDIKMWMVSAGGRRAMDPAGKMDWALLGDAGFARVETDDGVLTIQGITVDSWRIRLGLEGSYTSELEGGQTLTTFAEVAGRVDGGDGGEEVGLEVSPGVYLSDPASGFGIEARGRVLALSSADDYKEYGASVTANFSPRLDGTGLSMSVSPRWGAGSASGAETLWREEGIGSTGTGSADNRALSLNTRMSYGVATLRGVLAPFGELDLREQGRRRVGMGARFTPTRSGPGALSLEVSGERYENGGADPDHRVSITGRLRF